MFFIRVIFLLLNIILFITPLLIPCSVNAIYYKFVNNPIVSVGNGTDWDSQVVSGPSVIYENNLYKLWYYGTNGGKVQIGFASSYLPYSYQKFSNNPIILWNKVNDGNIGVEQPLLIKTRDSIYKLWFGSIDNSYQGFKLYYLSSNSDVTWSNQAVPLEFDISTIWESRGMAAPTVLYNDSDKLYRIWYVGKDNYTIWRIGYAYSTDGITWVKYPEPVMVADKTWEGPDLGNPFVRIENGIYHMWYHAAGGIGHATSPDGIRWEKDTANPVLRPGPENWDKKRILNPYILQKDGIDYLYYTGEGLDGKWQIGLATSIPITPIMTLTPAPSPTENPSPTITPSPTAIIPTDTPPPTPKPTLYPLPSSSDPVIILPGLGASWNPRAMLSCSLDGGSSWKLAPYVSVYNRLLDTLTKNAHMQLNRDVYLYTYDWRQSLDRQATDFNNYLQVILKNKPANTRFRVIGHSLGGLIIRSYLSRYPKNHLLSAALTVGSPHEGSVLAYPIWEKGELINDNNLIKIALFYLFNHCKIVKVVPNSRTDPGIKMKTSREIVHSMAPIIQDLLPTFPYIRVNGLEKNTGSMKYQNTWIQNHPFGENIYGIPFYTLSGVKVSTLRFLDVVQADMSEIGLGEWLDGKPVKEQFTKEGDGTVLKISSQLPWTNNWEIEENHTGIISSTEGIEKILTFLGLVDIKPSSVISIPEDTSKKILTLSLDGETTIELTNPLGNTVRSQDGIVTIYDPETGVYKLSIESDKSVAANLYLTLFSNGNDPQVIGTLLHLTKNVPSKFYLVVIPLKPIRIIPLR